MKTDVGHILVVDDNESNRVLLSSRLKRQGHIVQTASNGREALEAMAAEPFDLILLDIMMPEMDGYQVLEHLKGDPALRHLPVIVISALDDLDSVVRCVELGADDYLLKPFNPTLLQARIRSSLDRKRLYDREQMHIAAVQAATRAKSEFIAFIAHELKTPLTTIRGYIDVMLHGIGGGLNEEQLHYIATMRQSVDLMSKLVSDLTDIERIETGQIVLQRRPIHLPGLVSTVVETLRGQLAGKDQQLHVAAAPDLPPVWADQIRTIQVVTNLLSNAHKYTPSGGTISLSMEVCPARGQEGERQMVCVAVRDTGMGISAADLERIFEKYFRSTNSEAWNIPGTGLGLNISRRLIELQGGQIWCESVLGEGTTFHFTLPTVAETADGQQ
jgi:two-component system, sensor histidine kinase and response regulator